MDELYDPFYDRPDLYSILLDEMDITFVEAQRKIKEYMQTPYASFAVAVVATATGATTTVLIIVAGVNTLVVNIGDKDSCDLLVLTFESMASVVTMGRVYSILANKFSWSFVNTNWFANLGPNAIGAALDYLFGNRWDTWKKDITRAIDQLNRIKEGREIEDKGSIYDALGNFVPDFAFSQNGLSILNLQEFQKRFRGSISGMSSEEQKEILLAIMTDMSDEEVDDFFKTIEDQPSYSLLPKSEKKKYEELKKWILHSLQENKKNPLKYIENIRKNQEWICRQIIPSDNDDLGEDLEAQQDNRENEWLFDNYDEKYKRIFEELIARVNDIYGQSDVAIFEMSEDLFDFGNDQGQERKTVEPNIPVVDKEESNYFFTPPRQLDYSEELSGDKGRYFSLSNITSRLQQQDDKFTFKQEMFYENYDEKFKSLSKDLDTIAKDMYSQSDSFMLLMGKNLLSAFSNKGQDDEEAGNTTNLQSYNGMSNTAFVPQYQSKNDSSQVSLQSGVTAQAAIVNIVNNLGNTLSAISNSRWNGKQYVVNVELSA